MAVTYSFVDKVLYGTDDINGIVSSVVGAGIAPFLSAESYNLSDINSLTEALVGPGVQLGGCLCSVSGAGTGEMTVAVGQGIVFFESGVRLVVDEEGYIIPVSPNTAGYVYAIYRETLQMADIEFAEELPTNENYVLLAQVRADNTLKDCRSFACSKVATVGKNLMRTFEMEYCTPEEYDGMYIVQRLPGVDLSKFNYGILTTTNTTGGSFKYFPERGYYGAFFDITQGEQTLKYTYDGEESSLMSGGYFYRRYQTFGSSYGYYYIKIISGELCVVCRYESEKDVGKNVAYNCSVCLM